MSDDWKDIVEYDIEMCSRSLSRDLFTFHDFISIAPFIVKIK